MLVSGTAVFFETEARETLGEKNMLFSQELLLVVIQDIFSMLMHDLTDMRMG